MHALFFTGMSNLLAERGGLERSRSAGAYRMSTHLRQQGWDVEVLDFLEAWSLEQLKEYARSRVSSKTQWIGFGATFPVWNATIKEFIEWFKLTWPQVLVIAGGSMCHMIEGAHWYVHGFGERALDALLKHLAGTLAEPLRYRLGHNGKKTIFGNTDYPSFPMRDLSIVYEDRDFIHPHETLMTEIGRGCRFKCSFCNFPVLGVKEDHTRTADNFRDELQLNYDNWGVTNYMLADETVNDYTEKLIKFAGAVDQLNFRPALNGFARADLLVSRPQDWDIMIQMGFIGHHYGIESTNYESLKLIGKGMHPDRLLPGLLAARKYFKSHSSYRGLISLIVGLPKETEGSWLKTKLWILKNWREESMIAYPLYIPGQGETQAPSLLTEHWSKYGYRESPLNWFEQATEYLNKNGEYRELKQSINLFNDISTTNPGLNWENDHWTRLSATLEVAKWINEFKTYNPPCPWTIGKWMLATGRPRTFFDNKTYQKICDDTAQIGIVVTEANNDAIRDYILKKLNWISGPGSSCAKKPRKSDPGI